MGSVGRRPTLAVVDALCRLQLEARRAGCELTLRSPPSDLVELLELCGLADVLPVEPAGSGLEPERQPEEREELLGIQEERDPGDLAVGELQDLE